jgi:hypothetical protein
MDQSKQPRGDVYAPVNRYKQPGDAKPIFAGHLTKPGDDAKLPFALWAFEYEHADKATGEIVKRTGYSGSINGVAANIPADDQIAALLAPGQGADVTVAGITMRPGQIVLFHNEFKAEAPDKDRPHLHGWCNPTDGTPPFQVHPWIRQFEDSGRPYLSGATQYPLPGQSEREQQDAVAAMSDLVRDGTVTRGMPEKRKGRGGRGE